MKNKLRFENQKEMVKLVLGRELTGLLCAVE